MSFRPNHSPLRSPRFIGAGLAAVTALALAGCSANTSADDAGLKKGDPIVIASLESPVASGGPDFTSGMLVAADRINAKGGVGGHKIKVQVIPQDGTPDGIVTAYRSAGKDAKVLGAVLAVAGDEVKPISDQVALPVITSPGTGTVIKPPVKYVFDTTFSLEYAGSALTYLLDQHPSIKKIAVLHYDLAYSQSVESSVRTNCKRLGCEVVDVEAASAGASTDQLIPQLTKMRDSGADAYYIEGINPNGWKAARQLGLFDKPIIAENWLAVPAIAKACAPDCAGVAFATHKCRYNEDNWASLNADDPVVKWCREYVADWEKANPGKEYPVFSVYGYDGVSVIAQAVKQLIDADKPITRANIADQLENLNGEPFTSTGLVKHSSPTNHRLTGDWKEGYVMTQIKLEPDGSIRYVLADGADPAGATP